MPPVAGSGTETAKAAGRSRLARNPAGVIYGLIAIDALLAAESGIHETFPDTVASAIIATALYWLGHAYATALGERLRGGAPLSLGGLRQALAHDWAIVRGAAIPLAALVGAWALGAGQQTAVTVALWSAVAALIAFEALAARRSRASRAELAIDVAVGVALGLAILGLRIILGH